MTTRQLVRAAAALSNRRSNEGTRCQLPDVRLLSRSSRWLPPRHPWKVKHVGVAVAAVAGAAAVAVAGEVGEGAEAAAQREGQVFASQTASALTATAGEA